MIEKEYIGPEIISELRRNKHNRIIISQSVDVKCSKCFCVKTVNYLGHRTNRLTQLSKQLNNIYKCHSCVTSEQTSKRNKSHKGKTFEQLYGKQKAEKIKNRLSEIARNNTNPLWLNPPKLSGKEHPCFGKTYEQLFGIEGAIKRRKLCAHIGKKNAQYGKPAYNGSGNGWSGWYKEWYFRSIRELSFMINYIEKYSVKWESAETSNYAIPYTLYDGSNRHYFADFILNDQILVEVKPKTLINTPLVKLKKEAADKWCINRNLQYKIVSEDDYSILTKEEIQYLYNNNLIKWLPRYQKKYEELYAL